ncbi:MAG: glutamine synthetase III [Thermoguttaceae bacterium]|nr:glutamine synthetase III [Thermoguttaceae bacterium]
MNARQNAIEFVGTQTSPNGRGDFRNTSLTELYASHVFTESVQKERLPAEVFESLQQTVKRGGGLDPSIAPAVAAAMRDWAMERGATHYSHWFQPMTGETAEKHDSFLTPAGDLKAIAKFSGNELVRGESDASSFPSGGLRATFEARGYTAWDPSSPAFILENPNGATLVIPTMFVSWTGDSLDQKTPMLRSLDVLNRQALRLLRLFGNETASRVECTLGVEQEYFLVDRQIALQRPDLLVCGRTLFGARPPKGQELDDNYFGAIPERVLAFMTEVEFELMRLGVPIKTRHNEAAPGQFELAPTFETTNLALDHQMLVMQFLRQVARRHGFLCLLHEKPFAGVNGSGKHNNWSIGTDTGENLLNPGDTPESNLQFLVFCSAVCRAVHRYSKLLRLSAASPQNDFRLGAAEAPPAIMSIYLGKDLTDILDFIADGSAPADYPHEDDAERAIPMPILRRFTRHAGDRNRTSPFAFTGNKFEFRAVGSSQNSAAAVTIINTIVAESLDFAASRIEEGSAQGKEFRAVVRELLREMIREYRPVLFNGDNYSMEWVEEAAERGLPNLKDTVDCLPVYTEEESVALFGKYGVMNETELHSRQEIMAENYCTIRNIEASAMLRIAQTMIFPAVLRHKANILPALTSITQKKVLSELDVKIDLLIQGIDELKKALAGVNAQKNVMERARHYRDSVLKGMYALRVIVDNLEMMTDDELWPLPKYMELLFIR